LTILQDVETLWDDQTESFLLEQYPIHYLTRLSSHSLLAEPRPQPLPLLPLSLGLGVVGLGLLVKSRPWGGAVLAAALVTGGLSQVLTPQYAVLGFANPKPEDPYNIPGTEIEVQNIAQLAPESQIFVHEAANLETFKTQSSNYRYLHLATHGCFQQLGCCLGTDCDDTLPRETDLDANTLLFADGNYPLAEAALLGLNQTELVALSACQTALQTYQDQDAIAGMAYLWERAGARSVMATLWSVDDTATQELMTEFYRLVIEEGFTKVEALRQVKLQEAHRHPYFWSPLVLIGDPR
jgi:CHAT domain-containing protein